nr:four helix bundle protein [Pseudopedobacter sp.]
MRNDKPNLIVDLTFQFALDVIKFVDELEISRKFVFANQILKAGTSIGANVREAQNAESKADFIHKIKIAAKEADEVEYFLMLCNKSENYPSNDTLLEDIKSIIKVLSKIISSSKSI